MPATIEQVTSFTKVTPGELFELFMDSARHTAATGMPAKVTRKIGGDWSAFGGMIHGKTLAILPGRMIVQAWRSNSWKKTDSDSVLVVRFEKTPRGAAVYLLHVGVPSHDLKGVTKGWKKFYWEPWKKYLTGRDRPA